MIITPDIPDDVNVQVKRTEFLISKIVTKVPDDLPYTNASEAAKIASSVVLQEYPFDWVQPTSTSEGVATSTRVVDTTPLADDVKTSNEMVIRDCESNRQVAELKSREFKSNISSVSPLNNGDDELDSTISSNIKQKI
jgi:hypothetical protein